jgi:flagellin
MSVINTNISALSAQSSLRRSAVDSSTSMERLSTGIRINSAKDDAAGLAISTRMTANIRGMAAAIRNSNDGISLTQTAEGSLSAIQNNLQRIRELAVQAANSGNSASDRASLNLEAQQMITEIDRVAANSAFNGSKLLDGTFKDQSFQVGSGNDTTDRISISIGNAKASALGVVGATTGNSASSFTGAVTSGALAAGDLAIEGYAISATSSDGVSSANASASAIAKANAINASSSLTGVTATVQANTYTNSTALAASATGEVSAGALLINGVDIGSLSAAADVDGRANQLVAAINAKTAQTGVTAALKDGTTDQLTLTATDGRNITTTLGDAVPGGLENFADAGSTTTYAALTLTSTKGNSTIGITGGDGGIAKVGIASGDLTDGKLTLAASTVTGQTVSAVDLSTQANAQKALSILDAAIDTVTNSRANLGAYQNRFEAAISNLETTSTNLQASRSRILDTDYAKETTNLAKSQIVQQAATAMLAQANQSSQSVLALLK